MKHVSLIAMHTLVSLTSLSAGAQVVDWASPNDGNWNIPANWTGSNIPDTIGEDAILGLAGAYTVSMSDSFSIGSLTISNPLATLEIGVSRTLTLSGNLTNDGTITINFPSTIFNTYLSFDHDATIAGSGSILLIAQSDPGDAQILANSSTVTHAPGHTIHGSGRISGNIFNSGSIVADNPGGVGLVLAGTTTQDATGIIYADAGTLKLEGGSLTTGGTLTTINNGVIEPQDNATISDITNSGQINIPGNGGTLNIKNSIVNNGAISINSDENTANAHLRFDANGIIEGNGTISMISLGDLSDAQIYTAENITGTIGANQTVQGTGLVEGRSGGTIANNGVLRATINPKNPSAGLWLRGNHDGSGGGLYLADGGNLYLSNTLSLHGGIFDNTGTGIIDMISNGTATLSDVMNLGEIGIRGLGLVIAVAGPLTNNGIITINSDNNISYAYLRFDASTEINGAGTIHLQPGLLTDINNAQIRGNNGLVGTIGPGQTLTGSGILQGELNIEGTLDPSSSLRRFNIDILHLSPTSQLVVDLGGTSDGEFDRLLLNNTDSIDLDGSLTVNLDAGYTPVFGDVWNIIEGGTISGTFQTKNLPPPPLGMAYRVIEEIDRVFLVFTCRADLSGDTIVNFFDVSLFLTFFYNQDLRADMNDDGVLNFFDVSAFLAAYSQGCP